MGYESFWKKYVSYLQGRQRNIGAALGAWGAFVVDHTLAVFLVSLLCGLIATTGWLRLGGLVETRTEKLWTPQDSEPQHHREYVEPRFGEAIEYVQALTVDKDAPRRGNVLTVQHIRDTFAAFDGISRIEVDGMTYRTGLCQSTPLGCKGYGLLEVWGLDSAYFEQRAAGPNGLANILDDINAPVLPSGFPNTPMQYLYPTKVSGDRVEEATAMLWSFRLSQAAQSATIDRWYSEADKVFAAAQDEAAEGKVLWFHGKSLDDEIGAVTGSDIHLVALAFAVMCAFSTLALINRDMTRSRVALSLGGVLVVALSIAAAYGLCMHMGVMFSALTQLLPFILIGIGLDDIFVLVVGLDEVRALHPGATTLREQVRLTMETYGLSITVTSATNLIAFLCGSVTRIPSVKAFCYYAGVSIIVDYLLQISVFLSLLVLNERRAGAGYADVLCCVKMRRKTGAPSEGAASRGGIPSEADSELGKGRGSRSREDCTGGIVAADGVDAVGVAETPSVFHVLSSAYIRKVHAPALSSLPVRLGIVLCFVALAVAGIVGTLHVRQGLQLSMLTRSESDLGEFFRTMEATMNTVAGVEAMMYVRDVDFSEEEVQESILALWHDLQSVAVVDPLLNDIEDVWLYHVIQFAIATSRATPAPSGDSAAVVVAQEHFAAVFGEWTATPLGQYASGNIYVDPETGWIKAARFPFSLQPRSDPEVAARQLEALRAYCHRKSAEFGGGEDEGQVFAYTTYFIFDEGELILKDEVLINLGSAMAGVFAMTLLTLIHPLAAILCTASVASVFLGLWAVMWAAEIRFNSVSAINIVMASGISLDYTLHMTLHFVNTAGASRVERMRTTLSEMGPAIMLGGLSTLLGLLPLAGATTDLFYVFFTLMVSTIGIALAVGLLLIPALMGTIGPAAVPQRSSRIASELAPGAAEPPVLVAP